MPIHAPLVYCGDLTSIHGTFYQRKPQKAKGTCTNDSGSNSVLVVLVLINVLGKLRGKRCDEGHFGIAHDPETTTCNFLYLCVHSVDDNTLMLISTFCFSFLSRGVAKIQP